MLVQLRRLKEILDTGDTSAALRFAAKLKCLGEHRDAIQSGYAATRNPDFYREIGKDPAALYTNTIQAMQALTEAETR